MKLLIGLFLFVASLPMLWFSQFQNSAGTLSSATPVSADTPTSGFIRIEGVPQLTQSVSCPDASGRACVYAKTTVEEYKTVESVSCGTVSTTSTKRLLSQVEDECDESGYCRPCFRYTETAWQSTNVSETIGAFAIGAFTVKPSARTTFVGERTASEYLRGGTPINPGEVAAGNVEAQLGDIKTQTTYVPVTNQLLVAGEATEGFIGDTGSGLFVVSNTTYGETLAALKQNDRALGSALALGSFLFLVLGLVLIVAQFAAPVAGLARMIPLLGQPISHGVQGFVYVIVAIAGALLWGALYVLVFLVKNMLVAGILIGVVAVAAAIILPRLPKKS